MTTWTRRIRAAIGMGLIWSAAWFGAGLILARIPGFNSDVPFAILFAPLGFASGVLFAGILVALEGRHQLSRMSLSRFGGWGAVSGLLLSGIIAVIALVRGESVGAEILLMGLIPAVASAGCAVVSLVMARRVETHELSSGLPPDHHHRK